VGEAGKEERQIAIDNCYHKPDHIPAVAVIVDGGWSKRAHRHSYNAKSGVAVIIGKATGKILHMGVRNKYCYICSRHPEQPPPHKCFHNWEESSSAMESDIIVEGFKISEEKHGIRYTSFIGDGDSSVHSSLVAAVEWGCSITKIECANHSLKCYRSSLEQMVKENPSYKGKNKLTENMRKRLTKSARSAIIMRSKESDRHQAILKLERDLLNGPYHCFGYHTKCSIDFCKTAQQSAQHSILPSSSDIEATSTLQGNNSSNTFTDASATSDCQQDDLEGAIAELQQEWEDATDDTNLQEVRSIPAASTASPTPQEEAIICDIQRVLSRIVGKAPQLIGKLNTLHMH